jgi:hypothetical protein
MLYIVVVTLKLKNLLKCVEAWSEAYQQELAEHDMKVRHTRRASLDRDKMFDYFEGFAPQAASERVAGIRSPKAGDMI